MKLTLIIFPGAPAKAALAPLFGLGDPWRGLRLYGCWEVDIEECLEDMPKLSKYHQKILLEAMTLVRLGVYLTSEEATAKYKGRVRRVEV